MAIKVIKRKTWTTPEVVTAAKLNDTAEPIVMDYDCATIAAAKAQSYASASTNDQFNVAGYSAAGDGGGGPLYVDKADTTTADNGVTVFVASDGTRLKRPAVSVITPITGGAAGDRSTDDYAALQACIAVCEYIGASLVLSKRHRITRTLVTNGSIKIVGEPGHEIYYDGAGEAYPYSHAIVCESKVSASAKVASATAPAFNTVDIPMESADLAKFTVGDDVHVKYGVDKHDPNQPHYGYFTKVYAKDGSKITLTNGFPEASECKRIAYTSLSGGTFSAGDTITQGGSSAVVAYVQTDAAYAYDRLGLITISGTFSAGTITNGTATATLVVPYASASSVDAAHEITVSNLSSIAENSVFDGLKITFSYGAGKVSSGGICVHMARNVSIKNFRSTTNVVGAVGLFTHNLRAENMTCDSLVSHAGIYPSAFGGWNQINTVVDGLFCNTDRCAVSIESQCRNISLRNIVATRTGADASNPLIVISKGCRGVRGEWIRLSSVSNLTWFIDPRTSYTDERDIEFKNVEILGNKAAGQDLTYIGDGFVNDYAGSVKTWSCKRHQSFKSFLPASQTIHLVLPAGLYSWARVYFSSTTGVTALSFTGSSGSESGQGENLSSLAPVSGGWCKSAQFSTYSAGNSGKSAKDFYVQTDGTIPAESYVIVEIEYWPIYGDPDSYIGGDVPLSPLIRNGSPVGLGQVPRFINDFCFDTNSNKLYWAYGLTAADWAALN